MAYRRSGSRRRASSRSYGARSSYGRPAYRRRTVRRKGRSSTGGRAQRVIIEVRQPSGSGVSASDIASMLGKTAAPRPKVAKF